MKTWVNWRLRAMLVGAFGVITYLFAGGTQIAESGFKEWAPLFKDLGAALVISMIAALVFERLTHESLLDEVGKAVREVKESLSKMRETSGVLDGAHKLGIENIFDRRGKSRGIFENKIRDLILAQFQSRVGEVLILCVGAPELFLEGSPVSNILFRKLSEENNQCKLRVLLLSATSEFVKLRARLEHGHPVLEHIQISTNYLKHLHDGFQDKVEYRSYDYLPTAFLVITDEYLLIESYPLFQVDPGEGPIGGKAPMLQVQHDTETYRRWKGHFEFLWSESSNSEEAPAVEE